MCELNTTPMNSSQLKYLCSSGGGCGASSWDDIQKFSTAMKRLLCFSKFQLSLFVAGLTRRFKTSSTKLFPVFTRQRCKPG